MDEKNNEEKRKNEQNEKQMRNLEYEINTEQNEEEAILFNPLSNKQDFNVINNDNNRQFSEDNNNTLDLSNNKLSLNSSINTNATFDEHSKNINNNISFSSLKDLQINTGIQKKKLSKNTILILEKFIAQEKESLLNNEFKYNKDCKLFFHDKNNTVNNNNYNINNISNPIYFKQVKNSLNFIENSIEFYFKRPFMKKKYIHKKGEYKKAIFEDVDDEKVKNSFEGIFNEKLGNKNKTNKIKIINESEMKEIMDSENSGEIKIKESEKNQ